jgi:hypothetical protein
LLWEWRRHRRHRRHRRRRDAQTAEAAWDHGMRIHPNTRKQHDAALRAEQLLQRILTSEQLDHYRETNRVRVQTAIATYYLAAGQLIRAERDDGEFALCVQFAHPADGLLPPQDLMIAQLLLIRTDEDGLWKRFGPAHYRAGDLEGYVIGPGARARGTYFFGRGELIVPAAAATELRRMATTVIVTQAPVYFTERLEPRRLPLLEGNDVEP